MAPSLSTWSSPTRCKGSDPSPAPTGPERPDDKRRDLMPDNDALSDTAIRDFAVAWFRALDIHAPAEDFHPLLAEEGLELVFPERTMKSHADFDEWLDGIYHTFFDETHNLHEATPTGRRAAEADVDIL